MELPRKFMEGLEVLGALDDIRDVLLSDYGGAQQLLGELKKKVKASFKKKARELHPDVTGGDEEKTRLFKAANEAQAFIEEATLTKLGWSREHASPNRVYDDIYEPTPPGPREISREEQLPALACISANPIIKDLTSREIQKTLDARLVWTRWRPFLADDERTGSEKCMVCKKPSEYVRYRNTGCGRQVACHLHRATSRK